jgi:uncharacterized tellurite resistance protein B-like protein
MRALRTLLGLSALSDGAAERDTATLRQIAARLGSLEPETARYLAAFACVLARVAHADLDTSEAECRAMEQIVGRVGALTPDHTALVVQIARERGAAQGGTEHYLVTRRFREIASRDQRLALVQCLFEVAAADASISTTEEVEISKIGSELGLTHAEITSLRSAFREHLAILRPHVPERRD